ncbi:MAG: response regulator [Blautia sp.]|nr:response regulator [Blautia sp.]MDY3999193.1 response regulator [Blautia sp.]
MNCIKSIVVADDEPLQCEMLGQILNKIVPEAVVYTAKNGKEAYDFLENRQVDVLITDIRMPVMDGIELIRHASEEKPEVKIVLISAYKEFEYAREALKYRVVDYLLKPFRIEKVRDVMKDVNKMLEKELENSHQLRYYEKLEQLYQKNRQMEKLALLIKRKTAVEILDEKLYQSLAKPGTVMVLRWKKKTAESEGITELQQEKLLQSVHQICGGGYEIPQDKGIDVSEYRMALILPGITEQQAVDAMEKLLDELVFRRIIFWCGISGTCKNLVEEISRAVEEAEEMVSFSFFTRQSGGVFSWKLWNENLEMIPEPIANTENDIRVCIHNGNAEDALEKLHELEKKYRKKPYVAAYRLKHMISSMVMRIVRDIDGVLPTPDYDNLINEAYQSYGNCDSIEELFRISEELFQKEAAYYGQENGSSDVVQKIVTYIKMHYKEDLSLQNLAERAHFSTSYLSSRIKQRTGMTYSEYLMSLRMEEAVRLLLYTDRKVVDIVKDCGFNDSSYFNRIFRKRYNLSPEKYRKVHKHVEKNI